MKSVVYSIGHPALQLSAVPDLTWPLADVIKKLRKEKGWGRKKLAKYADVAYVTITRLEQGREMKEATLYLTRVRITGLYTGYSSNFVVKVAGRLIVNELLGTGWPATRYDGTLLLPNGGGVASVEISSGVAWTFTEVR